MGLKVQANELCARLKPLKCGITESTSLRQANCIIFQEGKAYTFSGNVFTLVQCDIGFEGAVDYKSLIDVLSKYGNTEVDISIDGDVLVVKKGRSRTKLNYQRQILLSLSSLVLPIGGQWKGIPASFEDAVMACENVAHYVQGDDVLSSINVTSEVMEAASTSQIIRYNCGLDIHSRFLIRSGILDKVIKSKPTEYQLVDRWFYLRSPSVVFAIPVWLDTYLDNIDLYLHPLNDTVVFPKELLEDIDVAKTLLDKQGCIVVSLADGNCHLMARGCDGVHESDCPMESPIDITFSISPVLLKKIVSDFPSCTIGSAGIRVHNDLFIYAASVN